MMLTFPASPDARLARFGLSRSLQQFSRACRRRSVAPTRWLFIARVSLQRSFLLEREPAGHEGDLSSFRLRRGFVASTSRFGIGQISGSNRTPLGLHRVAKKIGGGLPIGTVFEGRRPTGSIWGESRGPLIAHRILWLEGLEPGFNRGGEVDTFQRYIYIHGTNEELTLGRPASRGCVHLSAADLLWLYDLLPVGTLVWIDR